MTAIATMAVIMSQTTAPSTISEAIRARKSTRAFLATPIPEATLREVFELAQWAPSNCNTQPWLVHVASGTVLATLRQRLQAAAIDPSQHQPDFPYDGQYPGVYRERQHDAAARLYSAMGIAREDRAARGAAMLRNQAFFDAPHAAFVFMPKPFGLREAADCGGYLQTLMLALQERGLASCAQAALSFQPHLVREVLGVSPDLQLLVGLSFGQPDLSAPANACRTPRANLADSVTFHS